MSPKSKGSLLLVQFLPNFFGIVSIWAGFTIGRQDGENAEVLQAMYFSTGFICMSLFCVSTILMAMVDQGRCKSNNQNTGEQHMNNMPNALNQCDNSVELVM